MSSSVDYNYILMYGFGLISGILLKRYIFPTQLIKAKKEPVSSLAKTIYANVTNRRSHKMVFVVRTDLGMGKGKIAAQCAHAAVSCVDKGRELESEDLEQWERTGVTKVCLKAEGGESELIELKNKAKEASIIYALIRDAGHTQVQSGTITVLGLGPAPIESIDKITSHLKLL